MNETTMSTSPKKRKSSKRHKESKKKSLASPPLTFSGLLFRSMHAIPTVAGAIISFVLVIVGVITGSLQGGKRRREAIGHAKAKFTQLCSGNALDILTRILKVLWFSFVFVSFLSVIGIRVHHPFSNGDETVGFRGTFSLFNRGMSTAEVTRDVGRSDKLTDANLAEVDIDSGVPEQEGTLLV
jgi:hypothetical protein